MSALDVVSPIQFNKSHRQTQDTYLLRCETCPRVEDTLRVNRPAALRIAEKRGWEIEIEVGQPLRAYCPTCTGNIPEEEYE